ncbi:MAG: chemotaxis protein CheX [Desulfobacterales bacterium]
MDSALTEQLSQAMAKTLEDLTFLLAAPEAWEPAIFTGDELGVGVAFGGHFTGDLVWVCPASAAREMTANMLGLEDDEALAEPQINDALKEVLNIICGNILPILAGSEAVFNLSAPQILDPGTDADFGRPAPPVAKIKLDLEGEPGYLFLFIDDPEVAEAL